MATPQCPNCGAPIMGEAGFGMVMCEKCGELVMLETASGAEAPELESSPPEIESLGVIPPSVELPEEVPEKPSPIFQDVVEFGNEEQPATGFGSLVYTLRIEGIDTAETRQELLDSLTDGRLQIDVHFLNSQITDGVVSIPDLNPVKASVILNRLKHLPFKISWQSKQLIKALVVLGLFLGAGKGMAGDWAQHEASLKNYAIRISSMQNELNELIIKKNKNKDPAERDKLLDEIKKKDEEVHKLYDNFRTEKEHVIYEHPEQGDDTERKYKHVKLKSVDEMERENGVDGQLSRLKAKVERTYATPSPKGD